VKAIICDICEEKIIPENKGESHFLVDADNKCLYQVTPYNPSADVCRFCLQEVAENGEPMNADDVAKLYNKWKQESEAAAKAKKKSREKH